MLKKRSRGWRHGVAVAALLPLLANSSSAKGKTAKKEAEPAAPAHKAGLMEEGGKDPAETETLDEDGQFVPGKKKAESSPVGEVGESDAAAAGGEGSGRKRRPLPEPEKKQKTFKVRKTIGVFAEALIGFGEAPQSGPNNATTGKATSFGFLVGGHFDVTTAFRLTLRVPFTLATVQDAAHADRSGSALGAPEIGARYRLTAPSNSEFAVRLAVGIPVAPGNPDATDARDPSGSEQARVQRVADAANGWHDQELYAMKRIPISPALLYTFRDDRFRAGGELKATFMPKTGGNVAQPADGNGTYQMNSLAVTALLGGSASYEVVDHGFFAVAAWATYQVTPPIEYKSAATEPSPVQFVLEPKILAQFGRIVPSVGFLVPLGGQLGGKINGLRLHVDAVF